MQALMKERGGLMRILVCSPEITDDDLKLTPNLKVLILEENDVITDRGLSYLQDLGEIHIGKNTKITLVAPAARGAKVIS